MCVRARIALVLKLDYLSTIVCQQLKIVFSAAPSIYSSRANRATDGGFKNAAMSPVQLYIGQWVMLGIYTL